MKIKDIFEGDVVAFKPRRKQQTEKPPEDDLPGINNTVPSSHKPSTEAPQIQIDAFKSQQTLNKVINNLIVKLGQFDRTQLYSGNVGHFGFLFDSNTKQYKIYIQHYGHMSSGHFKEQSKPSKQQETLFNRKVENLLRHVLGSYLSNVEYFGLLDTPHFVLSNQFASDYENFEQG